MYHTDAIAQRFAEAIEHRLGKASAIDTTGTEAGEGEGEGERESDEMTPRAQLFVIRVVHDQFTVSADSSGALLHRRGYRKAIAKAPVRIRGSDRDQGAIAAARANAERAGVAADIEFSIRPLSAVEVAAETLGYVVTNPPYGIRVGEAAKLRDLYARFGQILRSNYPGWRLAMLSANLRLDAELRLPLNERLQTRNGGIAVRLLTADVPAAR